MIRSTHFKASLNSDQIKECLSPQHSKLLSKITVLETIASTNDYLKEIASSDLSLQACLAEQQTAGKGRRGRNWYSPPSGNIYLSLLWPVSRPLSFFNGLSLVIAITVIKALNRYGVPEELGVKWPNDILWQGRKLAGILIELYESLAGNFAIIGLGLNLSFDSPSKKQQDSLLVTGVSSDSVDSKQHVWVDLAEITQQQLDRNQIAGLLLDEILTSLELFQNHGLSKWLNDWQEYDILRNKVVNIIASKSSLTGSSLTGIARGIDTYGNLLLEDTLGEIHHFASGEVSVRVG